MNAFGGRGILDLPFLEALDLPLVEVAGDGVSTAVVMLIDGEPAELASDAEIIAGVRGAGEALSLSF